MAFIADLTDEEKQKAADQGSGVRTSGVIDGSATSSGNQGDIAKPTTTPGTGFINLQQYLDTNKGVGGKLAGDMTKGVNDSVDKFKSDSSSVVDQSKTNFASASQDDKANEINSSLKTNASGTYDDASKFLGSAYSGPQATDYTASLAADRDRILGNLNQVDNQTFQQAALKDTFGKSGNPYTQGFGLLDSFLINGDESGRAKLAEVKARGGEVGSTYDTSAQELSNAEKSARGKFSANKNSIRDTAKSERENLIKAGESKIANLNKTLDANKIETSAASLGDVFEQKNFDDLDALAGLSLQENNFDRGRTFNAGKERPPSPVVQPESIQPPPPAPPPPIVIPAGVSGNSYNSKNKYKKNKEDIFNI